MGKVKPCCYDPYKTILSNYQKGGFFIFKGHRFQRGGFWAIRLARTILPKIFKIGINAVRNKTVRKITGNAIKAAGKAIVKEHQKKKNVKSSVKAGVKAGAKSISKQTRSQLIRELKKQLTK